MGIYISDEIKQKIEESAELLTTMEHFIQFKPSGSNLEGECHACEHPKGMTYHKTKKIFKCFRCDIGGKYPTQYLMKVEGLNYNDAMVWLADINNIDITAPAPKLTRQKKTKGAALSFRDLKLKGSGIKDKNQLWLRRKDDSTEVEEDRYQKGTWDRFKNVDPKGNDIVLHYLDLDGKPTYYKNDKDQKKLLTRIRYEYPEQNTDKNGHAVKYRSPYNSGSHLWYPELFLKRYQAGGTIETLIIDEGELKSDALCQLKLWAVGLMGISNLSYDEMPGDFNRIIEKFDLKNIVFLLDTDWMDISTKKGKPVNLRPTTFFKAVLKFRNFFQTYNNRGHTIQIYFGTHKSELKGIDDYIESFKAREKYRVKELFEEALNSPSKESDGFQLFDITSVSDFKLKRYWHLASHTDFMDHHKEELIALGEFKLGRFNRKYNKEEDLFELDQQLSSGEQYWIRNSSKHGFRYEFHYIFIVNFLYNRNIGIYRKTDGTIWFIHIEDQKIKVIDHIYIQRYLLDFTMALDDEDAIEIAMFIKKGMSMYLGPQQCNLLRDITPNFIIPEKESQLFVYNNAIVKVTMDKISVVNNIAQQYWDKSQINRRFELIGPLFQVERKGSIWKFEKGERWDQAEICRFLYNTSDIAWKKHRKLVKRPNGVEIWEEMEKGASYTADEETEVNEHIMSKILAIGYLLHDYINYSVTRAIVCMDLKDSDIGASEGGSGKSIFAKLIGEMAPQHKVDGAAPKFQENRFRYEGLDERHKTVLIDDVRNDFDLKTEFSNISEGVAVQRKGLTDLTLGLKKFIITLNGMIRGNTNSYMRRQYALGFSDYYNGNFTPSDDFGHQMMKEWDMIQWTYFDNFMLQCLQAYTKFGLQYTIKKEKLEKRALRQDIGPSFLEWADSKYDYESSTWLNNDVDKKFMSDDLLREYPTLRKFWNVRKFKEKLINYAKYRGFEYNIKAKEDKRRIIKSNGREFICLSNKEYDQTESEKINVFSRIDGWQGPETNGPF